MQTPVNTQKLHHGSGHRLLPPHPHQLQPTHSSAHILGSNLICDQVWDASSLVKDMEERALTQMVRMTFHFSVFFPVFYFAIDYIALVQGTIYIPQTF